MSDFKIGDLVERINSNNNHINIGDQFIITRFNGNEPQGNYGGSHLTKNLKLIKRANKIIQIY